MLPTYKTLLAGDGLCELGPLRISSSMNYASQASTLVLDAPAVLGQGHLAYYYGSGEKYCKSNKYQTICCCPATKTPRFKW